LIAGAIGAESAEQRFKFGDLFKKTKPVNSTSLNQTATETKTAEAADATSQKLASNESASSTKKAASSSKEMLNSDQLKSLSGQLDKIAGDPDALLRTARERFRQMKEKESSAKPSAKDGKKQSSVKTEAKAEKKELTQSVPTTAAKSVKVSEKVVTSGAVPAASSRVVDPSRPPSLAPVTAVAAVPVTTSREILPENLRTDFAVNDVPLPKPLVAKKEKEKKKTEPSAMEITSDEVEMDNEKHTTTFIGNVNLVHPTFNLKSDRLVIHMHEEGVESEAPFRTAVATGARVIVERTNDKGGKDVGQSRKVVYDALTGDLELSGGPPQLQSGGNLVKTSSQEATITLKKDGNHSVNGNNSKGKNSEGRTKIIIPMGGKKGGRAGKGPNLIPSKLGDISKRK